MGVAETDSALKAWPRQIFQDYDAGAAVAKKERVALAQLLREALKHLEPGDLRERVKRALSGE